MSQRVDRERVRELHRAGLRRYEVAEALGCSPWSVRRVLVQLGELEPVPPMRPPTPERLEQYRAAIEDGWSFDEIVRQYGTTWETLCKYFPGRAWTPQQVGAHARTIRQAREAAQRNGVKL